MSDTLDVGSKWQSAAGEIVTIISVRDVETTTHFPTVVDFTNEKMVATWTLPEFVKYYTKVQ